MVKTRLQLEQDALGASRKHHNWYGGSWDTIKQIAREEGVRGFYKGLSASYLGVTEGTIQWVLYERLKKMSQKSSGQGGAAEWMGLLGSAGTAKCVATLITYPHEVSINRVTGLDVLFLSKFSLGRSNTVTAATCERQSQIHRSGANIPACHR